MADIGQEAPSPFIWAYHHLLFSYQNTPLQSIQNSILQKIPCNYLKRNNKKISSSEWFFICTELIHATESQQTFIPTDTIYLDDIKNNTEISIYTDDRYFKIPLEGEIEIYDLGYNILHQLRLND